MFLLPPPCSHAAAHRRFFRPQTACLMRGVCSRTARRSSPSNNAPPPSPSPLHPCSGAACVICRPPALLHPILASLYPRLNSKTQLKSSYISAPPSPPQSIRRVIFDRCGSSLAGESLHSHTSPLRVVVESLHSHTSPLRVVVPGKAQAELRIPAHGAVTSPRVRGGSSARLPADAEAADVREGMRLMPAV